jgi:hypothetical protein
MKVNGLATREMDRELCTGSPVTKSMREIGRTTSRVDSVLIFGLMDQPTPNYSETDMWVIGDSVRDMERVHSITLTEVNMRENGKRITSMAMVYSLLKMEPNMSDLLRTIECLRDKFLRKRRIKLLFSNRMISKRRKMEMRRKVQQRKQPPKELVNLQTLVRQMQRLLQIRVLLRPLVEWVPLRVDSQLLEPRKR